MPFCSFTDDILAKGRELKFPSFFATEYVPNCPDGFLKIFLYGQYLCQTEAENTIESFAQALSMSEEDLLTALCYWEKEGLVRVMKTYPVEVRFLPILPAADVKEYNVSEFSVFNKQAQDIIGRTITPSEYEEYYYLIKSKHIEQEAFLMIMKYCTTLKSEKIGHSYICRVAKNWAEEGYLTVTKVEERLKEFEAMESEIGEIFAALGMKRISFPEEKEMIQGWKDVLNFPTETIKEIIKLHRKNHLTLAKLNSILEKYARQKLYSLADIRVFEQNKSELIVLARSITTTLGVYYDTVDMVIETYLSRWLALSFDGETLIQIAVYCFKTGKKTLQQMDAVVEKFYKLGLLSLEAIEKHLSDLLANDEEIRQLLITLGEERAVNKWDREFYQNWITNWNISPELLAYAVTLTLGKTMPMQYLNKILANFVANKALTVEEAKKFAPVSVNSFKYSKIYKNKENEFSVKDLNVLFDKLEEIQI